KDEEGNTVRYLYKWTFEKEFEIKKEVADKLNAKDVSIEKEDFPWLYVIIGALILLIAILLLILFLKRKKDKDEEAK
ncbi:LPXTG cell wall anchor domain-containing protein, partial [Enterococcus phoeniculicola]